MAESTLAPELAADAYRAASSLPQDPSAYVEKLTFELMYHASFGEIGRSISPARELIALSSTLPRPSVQCRTIFNAAAGLLRAGALVEGCASLRTSYEVALGAGLPGPQQLSASLLANILLMTGRTDEARLWWERSLAVMDQLDAHEIALEFYSTAIQFAMAEGDYRAANMWLDRSQEQIPRGRVGSPGLHFAALRLRLKQLSESYDCTETELRELLECHLGHRTQHHHDEVMETVWHALARKDRVAEAQALVSEYFTVHRRHQLPVTRGLMRILDQGCAAARAVHDHLARSEVLAEETLVHRQSPIVGQ
jgi:hypothetical protein